MELTYIVPPEMDGETLQHVLRNGLKLSATQCRLVKKQGGVWVDGESVYANQRMRAQMRITCVLRRAAAQGEQNPKAAGLHILYEDEALLCVDKPGGIVCHPTRGLKAGEETMLGRATAYLGYAPCMVHRLDRGTTGLLLFAKHAHVQHRLQMREKRYEAICVGVPKPLQGEMDAPILTHPDSARRTLHKDGQRARTGYAVQRSAQGLSRVALELHTGRTHQIRVHMAALGCPLLGDALYGDEISRQRSAALGMDLPLLRATALTVEHPLTGEVMRLACDAAALLDPLPEALRDALER